MFAPNPFSMVREVYGFQLLVNHDNLKTIAPHEPLVLVNLKINTMRPLINLSIMLLLPMVIGFSSYHGASAPASASREDGRYCNARFDFCLNYPNQLFTQKDKSDNDDGVRLTSADGKFCLEASGSYNVANWSLTDIYDFTFQDITADHPDEVKYISYNIGKTSYEATFQYANELHYYHTVLLPSNNSFVTLLIFVPIGMESMLDNLKDDVSLDTHM